MGSQYEQMQLFCTLVGRKYTSLQLCSCRLVLKVHNNDTYDASIQLDSIHKLIGLVSLGNETACSTSWNILLNTACSLRGEVSSSDNHLQCGQWSYSFDSTQGVLTALLLL